jgi:hypothetical protein
MLTKPQSIKLILPDLISEFNSQNKIDKISIKIEDFKNDKDIGLISYTGKEALINLNTFLALSKKEQISTLAFLSLCVKYHSEFEELEKQYPKDQESKLINLFTHFYILKCINENGYFFKESSFIHIKLKEDIELPKDFNEGFLKLQKLGVDNILQQ